MRPAVFWPPALVLIAALTASLVNYDGFVAFVGAVNEAMLSRFGWLVSLITFSAVALVGVIFLSPLGAARIGGARAKPILSRWNWFAITLTTTIATGILFWGAAEPMYHLADPPDFAGVDGDPRGAARFALSTVYLHWSITPYAIYAVSGLAFALAFHNLKGGYSFSALIAALIGRRPPRALGDIVDALALFALVTGVAASLGAGVMTLVNGLGIVAGLQDTVWSRLAVTVGIVLVYVVSSISGLQRGIRILSDINIRFFIAMCAFVLFAGPTVAIVTLGAESLGQYARDFLPRSLGLGGILRDPWTLDWTVFFFANWLAWAPVTALFLGRIAVGYTVREFIAFNMLLPASFGAAWMTIFGGASIMAEGETAGALSAALSAEGPEAVIYALFGTLPLTGVLVVGFVFATFISFVTAMDSNTHSITGVCLRSDAVEDMEGPTAIGVKLFWGILIGAVSWTMTATNGIDGMRLLVNLGGAPGLFILTGSGVVLLRIMLFGAAALNSDGGQSSES